jgi:hypothetical protein
MTIQHDLVIDNYYDILDIGDEVWRTDFKYVGQAMSGEHIFKWKMFSFSTEPDQYLIVTIPDNDVVACVRESID